MWEEEDNDVWMIEADDSGFPDVKWTINYKHAELNCNISTNMSQEWTPSYLEKQAENELTKAIALVQEWKDIFASQDVSTFITDVLYNCNCMECATDNIVHENNDKK